MQNILPSSHCLADNGLIKQRILSIPRYSLAFVFAWFQSIMLRALDVVLRSSVRLYALSSLVLFSQALFILSLSLSLGLSIRVEVHNQLPVDIPVLPSTRLRRQWTSELWADHLRTIDAVCREGDVDQALEWWEIAFLDAIASSSHFLEDRLKREECSPSTWATCLYSSLSSFPAEKKKQKETFQSVSEERSNVFIDAIRKNVANKPLLIAPSPARDNKEQICGQMEHDVR